MLRRFDLRSQLSGFFLLGCPVSTPREVNLSVSFMGNFYLGVVIFQTV